MRLLLCLAEHPGEVVSIDQLLDQVWAGVIVTQDSVYQAVTSLRRMLGDDPKQPTYIATVPRLGYRMVASVGVWVDVDPPQDSAPPHASDPPHDSAKPRADAGRSWALPAVGAALAVAIILAFLVYGRIGGPVHAAATPGSAAAGNSVTAANSVTAGDSVAVLPFLDLTSESMDQEYFADGMTEELIDRLSKIPGLRVPPPTSSFYFKGKKVPLADIAKSLGVAYVLDGSLRKSGNTMRVAARLVRADSGFVVWSETYDRRLDDTLKVQDDIADQVTKALVQGLRGNSILRR